MFEPYGRDNYFQGPSFSSVLPAGRYRIVVWSSNNDSAYSLAVGETESFSIGSLMDAYRTLPRIKSSIFGRPAYEAFLTPILGGPIVLLVVLCAGGAIWYSRRRHR
jgi:hypothetical protein